MPKVYLSLQEKRQAEVVRKNAESDNILRMELMQAKSKKRVTYEDIAIRADISKSTVQKIFNMNVSFDNLELGKLRRVCAALDVPITISST